MAECAEEITSVPCDGYFLRIQDKVDGILPDHFPAEPFAAFGVDEIHRAGVHFRPAGSYGKDHAVRQECAGVFDSAIVFFQDGIDSFLLFRGEFPVRIV